VVLVVLRRQVARPRHSAADRLVLVTLAALPPRERWGIFLVTPSTLLRWHRELVRRRSTYPRTGRRDRRRLPEDVVELVVRLARENRRWGRLRIVGECRKLGVTVSATSVRSILRSRRLGRAPRRDGPSWAEFLWALYLVTGNSLCAVVPPSDAGGHRDRGELAAGGVARPRPRRRHRFLRR
jgi:putative transposase